MRGIRQPMVKMFAFLPKRPDISVEKFHAHWRDPHGEISKRITTIRRYVQAHRLAEPPPGLPQSIYEGVAEAWFDDVQTGLSMGEDPNYIEGAGADEPNFIDLPNLTFLFTREHVITEGPAVHVDTQGVKLLHLINRAQGVDKASFAEGYGAIAHEHAAEIGARRDVLCLADPDVYSDEDAVFDAVHELTFESADTFLASRERATDGWAALAHDELIDGPGLGLLAEEYRVIWPEA